MLRTDPKHVPAERLSLVMPIRNAESRVVERVESALEQLEAVFNGPAEIVVVDDGSTDSTLEVLEDVRIRYPQVRIARHSRPRGMESAGQTGLERSTGDLVFILESDAGLRLHDLRKLINLAQDDSIVAARAETETPEPTAPLVRRLRLWADRADQQFVDEPEKPSALQMVRKPHLNRMSGPAGARYRLSAETLRVRDDAVSSIGSFV